MEVILNFINIFMIKLQYYSHLILFSKYKFILYLSFSLLVSLMFNTHYTYCLESESEENTAANKYLGMGLFLGFVALMLFIQKFSGGSDPTTIVDLASSISESVSSDNISGITIEQIAQDPREYLDVFNITNTGTLEILGMPIDTKNVYLNADKAISQMQENISDRMDMLIEPIRQFHFKQEPSRVDVFLDAQTFIDAHVAYLKEMDKLVDKQAILLYQDSHFLKGLIRAGLLDSSYMKLYDQYLSNGGKPDQFYNFLISRSKQR